MKITGIEFDEHNEPHATSNGVSVLEKHQVFANHPVFARNKKAGTADFVAQGKTDGGRQLLVFFVHTREGNARPISAREARK